MSGNIISGRPTTARTFTFAVRLPHGSGQTATKEFSITIS